MSNALSARWLMPLLAAVLLALVVLAPGVGVSKAKPASTPGKRKAARLAGVPEVATVDYAAASRLLRRADAAVVHPEKATAAQLVQAAHDLIRAAELEPDLELQPWFHAHLGSVFYARVKAKQGPERRYLLERANVQLHLAALTHHILLNGGTDVSRVTDYHGAGDATASFILYHVGLTEYELGRPSSAVFALDLLLAAAADRDLERPEYVAKARILVAEVRRAAAKHGQWVPPPPSSAGSAGASPAPPRRGGL